MKRFLFGFALLLSLNPTAQATGPYFFGGVGSTKADTSACLPHMHTFGYPATNQVSRVVAEINAHPNEPVTLVGHSSGAAYVNQVAGRVKNPSRITLISLDGFTPSGVPKAVSRTCWKATNGRGKWSKNARYMTTANGCGTVRTFTAPHCESEWCLHFALVNLATPKSLSGKNFIGHGYDNCKANSLVLSGRKPVQKAGEEVAVEEDEAPAKTPATAPKKKDPPPAATAPVPTPRPAVTAPSAPAPAPTPPPRPKEKPAPVEAEIIPLPKPSPKPAAPKAPDPKPAAPALKPVPEEIQCALGDMACERRIYAERIKRALGCFSEGAEAANCPLRSRVGPNADESRVSSDRRVKTPAPLRGAADPEGGAASLDAK